MHNKAHGDGAPPFAWLEWGAPEIGDVAERARWYETNPSLGTLIDETAIEGELSMSPDDFARERLGWWTPVAAAIEPVIEPEEWELCRSTSEAGDALAFGVKFSLDGATVAIAVAATDGDKVRIELVDARSTGCGTRWLAQEMARRASVPWVVDGRSGASALIERVSEMECGVSVLAPTASDAIAASSGLLDAVREREVTWYGPDGAPVDRLTNSVTTSTRRSIGSAGGWGFGGSDSAPVEAAALALWAARRAPSDDGEEMEVYF